MRHARPLRISAPICWVVCRRARPGPSCVTGRRLAAGLVPQRRTLARSGRSVAPGTPRHCSRVAVYRHPSRRDHRGRASSRPDTARALCGHWGPRRSNPKGHFFATAVERIGMVARGPDGCGTALRMRLRLTGNRCHPDLGTVAAWGSHTPTRLRPRAMPRYAWRLFKGARRCRVVLRSIGPACRPRRAINPPGVIAKRRARWLPIARHGESSGHRCSRMSRYAARV